MRYFLVVSALVVSVPAYAASLVIATVAVQEETWTPSFNAVGNLVARYGTDLAFQTPGLVTTLSFSSGTEVAAGTPLAQLQLNDEPGILAQYEAQAALDEIIFNRDTKQWQAQAVSRAVVDHDRLTLAADRAHVVSERAIIAMKTLRAPFSGTLGVRQVNPGQYLQPGTVVVTLQALDPIFADFYVPQNRSPRLSVGSTVSVSVDACAGRSFKGKITAITPEVDRMSRTILVRATLDNHDHALVPGMFATVKVEDGLPERRLTLPSAAIVFATYGSSAWVVNDGKAHQVAVTTGPARGNQVSIVSGLHLGQLVVSAGQTKLYEGANVIVNNSIEPNASPDPNVADE